MIKDERIVLKVLAMANGDYYEDVMVDSDFPEQTSNQKFIEIQVKHGKAIKRISINPDYILSFEVAT